MDVNNIALVRATNIIPFDGIVRPVSEVPYLKINTSTQFSFAMSDLLRKVGKIPPSSFKITREDIENREKVLKQYIPYMSDYNSMVLWAINGLVPDDSENGFGNNTFSNKKCVIIDGLAEQLQLSNVVSLVPTDTAIRGNVKLSNAAIILIEQGEYDSLSEQQKEQLSSLNVKTFSGNLRQAVEQTLLETGRYIPERPTLSRTDGGFRTSDTSEELKETINSVAKENNILQMYHFNILINGNREKLGELADEFDNINIVNTYFQRQFFEYISNKMNINRKLASDLNHYPNTDFYIKQLCNEIESYGIENYKKLVDEYNQGLEQLQKEGKLPTPQQIVDLVKKYMQKDEDEIEQEGIGIDD